MCADCGQRHQASRPIAYSPEEELLLHLDDSDPVSRDAALSVLSDRDPCEWEHPIAMHCLYGRHLAFHGESPSVNCRFCLDAANDEMELMVADAGRSMEWLDNGSAIDPSWFDDEGYSAKRDEDDDADPRHARRRACSRSHRPLLDEAVPEDELPPVLRLTIGEVEPAVISDAVAKYLRGSLPADIREVVDLHINGYALSQISESMGTSESSVQRRLRWAKRDIERRVRALPKNILTTLPNKGCVHSWTPK